MRYFIIEKYFSTDPFQFLSSNYTTKTTNKTNALYFDGAVEAYRACLILQEIRPEKTYEVMALEDDQGDQEE